MADQTQGAVDSLVVLLSTAIKDEAKLLGGVQGDMQFIKDEMESMNGFLLHLTKTDGVHDDQLRAWMKQVRDIAYIAHDCIELYKRDFADPIGKGPWALLQNLPTYIRSIPARHRLANRIRELKVRVLDVGKRRQRYDISIPQAKESQLQSLSESQGNQEEINKIRQEFLRVLALDKQQQEEAPTFDGAIDLLPEDLKSAATTVRGGLDEWLQLDHQIQSPATTHRICMEMLLRALRAHRKVRTANTKEELEKLAKAPDRIDLPAQVMIFCYSTLSRSYKSCFQYLCAFRDETAISRTSLVRRWVAEGLVEKQDGRSLEEAAELCFQELLFRGFLLPHHRGYAGKVKSCKIDDTVWEFAYRMSASENFVSSLPTYLSYQLRIRKFVKEQEKELEKNPQPQEVDSHRSICGFRQRPRDDTKAMDDMVSLLGTLPQGYRLNVLDLGGCRGLKRRHLNSICNVHSLKYPSLRNTAGVCRLPRAINKLRLLETLDIRQTELQQQDTERICLPNLKHLLTGTKMTDNDKEPLYAGSIPSKIGKMRDMEILSWVQVQEAQELENVSHLQHLRKLGVVLGGKGSEAQDNMNKLLHAITQLEYLRSLSIWVTPPPTNGNSDSALKMEMTEQHLIIAPKILQSLHISGISLAQTGLPSWILQPQLSEITLCNTLLSNESLQKLGTHLPRLCCLRLRRNSYNDCKLTFNRDGFKALKFLIVQGDKVTTVEFEEEGTTPLLEKIVWRNMSLDNSGSFSGIHHLAGKLEEVELKGLFDVRSIEAWSGCKVSYDLEVPVACVD